MPLHFINKSLTKYIMLLIRQFKIIKFTVLYVYIKVNKTILMSQYFKSKIIKNVQIIDF